MIAQLNLAVWAWLESWRDLFRPRVWRPFALLGAVQAGIILLLTQFHRPLLSWALVPLLSNQPKAPWTLLWDSPGPAVLHYPQFFLALPFYFSRVNVLLDWWFGSFCYGVAILGIWAFATQNERGATWATARRRWPLLVLAQAPTVILLLVTSLVMPRLTGAEQDLHGWGLRMYRLANLAAVVLWGSLFLYVPMFLLIEKRNLFSALGKGLQLFARVPLTTLLVFGFPNLAQVGVDWLFRRADKIVQTLAPESVTVLVLFAICVYVLVNFTVIGAAVRIYGARAQQDAARGWS